MESLTWQLGRVSETPLYNRIVIFGRLGPSERSKRKVATE